MMAPTTRTSPPAATATTKTTRFGRGRRWVAGAVALLALAAGGGGCASNKPAEVTPTNFSFWPAAPDEPRVQFVTSFVSSADLTGERSALDKLVYGKEGEDVLNITKPYGVRMWQGKIYVCDISKNCVTVLDLKTRLTRAMGVTGADPLRNPTDIAIAPDGMKYVADKNRNAVVVFDASDRMVAAFGDPNLVPIAVAVFGDELAVCDQKGQRVIVLDRASGQLRRTIGSQGLDDGKFILPISCAYDPQGNLYVSDFMKCRVTKFDRAGKVVKGFGTLARSVGNFVRPKHITVDSEGLVYVVDAAFNNVQVFDPDGRLLTFFGGAGSHPGYMKLPVGVATWDGDLDLFKDKIHPAFEARRLVLVTNQFGANRVAVFAIGQLKPGKTAADVSAGRTVVTTGIDMAATTRPSTRPIFTPDMEAP